MKPFLGIDVTENKKNDKFNGEEFIVTKVSSASIQAYEGTAENAVEITEKAKLPLTVRIFHWLCGAVGGITAIGIVKALGNQENISVAEIYYNAPWMFWLSGICLAIWAVLTLISRKKAKTFIESEENEIAVSKLRSISNNIFAEMDVPPTAEEVDVLSFSYKMKNGEPKAVSRSLHSLFLQMTPFMNFSYKIYTDGEFLYLADLEMKYKFPLSSFRAIHTVKKNISISEWNKETPPNKGEYKQYKLRTDDEIHMKKYYILEFEHNGEAWGIYFPIYELSTFEKLTGLKAE